MELDTSTRKGIETFIARQTKVKSCAIVDLHRLSGGAIQENWYLDVDIPSGPYSGRLEAVLRTDATSKIAVSLSRAQEFSLIKAAFDAGVTVPEPLWLNNDPSVTGTDFFIMRRISGDAAGHRLVKNERVIKNGERLVERLAEELAKIHSVKPSAELEFLTSPKPNPAIYWVNEFRGYLDEYPLPHPVLELALRWLERRVPNDVDLVLCHHDFRTGNYMVDEGILTGILDWEFAGWSDFHEDIGWFCAKCWRFGANDREAGGIGNRNTFYTSYENSAGRQIDHDIVFFWEIMAYVRWATIALQQAQRFLSGKEASLEAALTGHVVPGLEFELLQMIRDGG